MSYETRGLIDGAHGLSGCTLDEVSQCVSLRYPLDHRRDVRYLFRFLEHGKENELGLQTTNNWTVAATLPLKRCTVYFKILQITQVGFNGLIVVSITYLSLVWNYTQQLTFLCYPFFIPGVDIHPGKQSGSGCGKTPPRVFVGFDAGIDPSFLLLVNCLVHPKV